jgi:hypothetical protein
MAGSNRRDVLRAGAKLTTTVVVRREMGCWGGYVAMATTGVGEQVPR